MVRLRSGYVPQARRLGVSAATVFHASWSLVVSQDKWRELTSCLESFCWEDYRVAPVLSEFWGCSSIRYR